MVKVRKAHATASSANISIIIFVLRSRCGGSSTSSNGRTYTAATIVLTIPPSPLPITPRLRLRPLFKMSFIFLGPRGASGQGQCAWPDACSCGGPREHLCPGRRGRPLSKGEGGRLQTTFFALNLNLTRLANGRGLLKGRGRGGGGGTVKNFSSGGVLHVQPSVCRGPGEILAGLDGSGMGPPRDLPGRSWTRLAVRCRLGSIPT